MKEFAFLSSWADPKADLKETTTSLKAKGIVIDLIDKTLGRFFKLHGRKKFEDYYTVNGMLAKLREDIKLSGIRPADIEVYKTEEIK